METSLVRTIHEEEFIFDCRRIIYWPRRKIMLAADLHWGKTNYLRNHGIAITDKVFEADLNRLSHCLADYETTSLIVLGDLIHHEKSLSRGLIAKVANFREENPCELVLVKGNHDRYTDFPESWGIVEEKDFKIGHFSFLHEHNPQLTGFQFSGHIHPMMRLRAGVDELRLPSFILDKEFCLLPAFSHLTGGQDIKLEKGQSAFVLLDEGLDVFER
ncbi:ligase-associated DNA damage response endonuclease PdeM [Peredibacter starrii]|uniref:Ligase-associated DNA damage response endonuclease PdeM n=1 Tax=Peredibacter starrii TaxID=28202 RepID=A0AAX4HPW7_9BACT|nr:ligase-associated DNA damage response endonuclease PdeM [Peredibacter starrii]WPU65172.1 ligase-associated DNA damage response endonuclease PdeM [Peredibacter starrii]